MPGQENRFDLSQRQVRKTLASEKNIVIVDDEMVLRESLARLFRAEGYWVRSAASGTEALKLLRENRVDLVLLDWNMPGTSGAGVLRSLGELNPRMPVIVVTGRPDQLESIRSGNLRAVLAKPLEVDDLIRLVGQLLYGHDSSLANELAPGSSPVGPVNSGLVTSEKNTEKNPLTSAPQSGHITLQFVAGFATRSSSLGLKGGVQ
jgi:DNA-binding response OmpR family regulator